MAEDKVLRFIIKDLKKKLGDKNPVGVGIMGDGQFAGEPKEFFPTGSSLLDRAINGGFPIGRLTEIFGDVAVGKSVLLLTSIARAQQQGAMCFYLDGERASSRDFAIKLCGVDTDNLVHLEPKCQEDIWNIVFAILKSAREADESRPIFIGIDSLASVGPRAALDKTFEEQTAMALSARIIREAMRILTTQFSDDRAALVFTNHEIFRINAPAWGEKTQSWGGTAPKYFSSVRIKLDQIGWEKEDGDRVGAKIRATVYKNRFDPPGRQVDYTIYNRGPLAGIDDIGSVVDFLYYKHALGSTKGYVEWEGKKFRTSALADMARKDAGLFSQLKEKAFALYDVIGNTEENLLEEA